MSRDTARRTRRARARDRGSWLALAAALPATGSERVSARAAAAEAPAGQLEAAARIAVPGGGLIHRYRQRAGGLPVFDAEAVVADPPSAPPVLVVWPGEDPLGKAWDEATVVGVVGNAPTVSLANPEASEFYHPIDDEHVAHAVMIVRVDGYSAPMTGVLVAVAV